MSICWGRSGFRFAKPRSSIRRTDTRGCSAGCRPYGRTEWANLIPGPRWTAWMCRSAGLGFRPNCSTHRGVWIVRGIWFGRRTPGCAARRDRSSNAKSGCFADFDGATGCALARWKFGDRKRWNEQRGTAICQSSERPARRGHSRNRRMLIVRTFNASRAPDRLKSRPFTRGPALRARVQQHPLHRDVGGATGDQVGGQLAGAAGHGEAHVAVAGVEEEV